MGFIESITSCMMKAFDFSGRASRSEFWWFVLVLVITHTALTNLFSQSTSGGSFHFGFKLQLDVNAPWWSNLYAAVFTLPLVSVFVRRAHDNGIGGDKIFVALFVALTVFTFIFKLSPTQSTMTWLLMLIIGTLFLGFLFLTLKKSDPNTNRFGPNPLSNPQEVPQ